jgi:hypothetical protein
VVVYFGHGTKYNFGRLAFPLFDVERIPAFDTYDGVDALAIGVPDEDVGSVVDAGAVNVLYGRAQGLSDLNNQVWDQDKLGVLDVSEEGDHFGCALAAGDLNGDGFIDLAIGAPEEDVGAVENAGAVNVLYGTALQLSSAGNQFWNQDTPNVEDDAE